MFSLSHTTQLVWTTHHHTHHCPLPHTHTTHTITHTHSRTHYHTHSLPTHYHAHTHTHTLSHAHIPQVIFTFDHATEEPSFVESVLPTLLHLATNSDLYLITQCTSDQTEQRVMRLLRENGVFAAGMNENVNTHTHSSPLCLSVREKERKKEGGRWERRENQFCLLCCKKLTLIVFCFSSLHPSYRKHFSVQRQWAKRTWHANWKPTCT